MSELIILIRSPCEWFYCSHDNEGNTGWNGGRGKEKGKTIVFPFYNQLKLKNYIFECGLIHDFFSVA